MSKLTIPVSKKFRGLYIFCNACHEKSKFKLLVKSTCNHPDGQIVYKAIFNIPGTKSIRSRQFKTKDIDEAIKQTIDFEKELRATDFKPVAKTEIFDRKPLGLVECLVMYLDYLENKNVYNHQINQRSKGHIDQVKRYLQRFIFALKAKQINVNGLLVRNVNDQHVSIFHAYILNKYPKIANRTFNRHIDTVSEFFNYLIEVKHYSLVNYFSPKNIIRKRVHSHIETSSITEFKELLSIISMENGIEMLSTGEKKYHYYDWLEDAFKFALFSGRRRDEIMDMKFSDIVESDGRPIYIVSEDYKYNRKNNLIKKEEKKYNYTPVILDLHLFLQKLGYQEHKGTDRYLIAPDSTRRRETLKDDMSKSFTHYYKQLNTGKNLEFKHLRKTYITLLNNHTNGHAEVITGQSGQELILKSYQDRKIFDDVIVNFRMIS